MIQIINLNGGLNPVVKRTNYPAGEVGFLIEDNVNPNDKFHVSIWIYTSDDLLEAVAVLGHLYDRVEHVDICYLGFARQDKEKNVIKNGIRMNEIILSSVVTQTIFSFIPSDTTVSILDPHGHTENILTQACAMGVDCVIREPINLFGAKYYIPTIVFPDEGAEKRYKHLFVGHTMTFHKKRGDDGKIIEYGIKEGVDFYPKNDILVFDDICDGGATFIEVAKKLKEMGHTGKLYLQVTHGLFSKGKQELLKYYDEIRTMTTSPYHHIDIIDIETN